MAYKFQLGTAKLSGSIEQTDGTGDLKATTVDSLVSEATVSGSGNFSVGGNVILGGGGEFSITRAGVATLGATTASTFGATGLASLDGGINVDDNFTVDAAGAVVAVGVNAGGAISGATTIDGSGDLTMGTITMTGFSVDADGDTVAKTVAVPDDGTIGNATRADMLTLAAAAVTVKNDADFNVAKAGGLQLAGAAVTSTAAELNLLDAIARGSIIVGNSSGASALLAKGAAGTVLKSDGTDVAYGSIVNADVGASAAIAFSKLAALDSTNILVGNGSNVATKVALSGDATLSNAGAITLASAQTNVATITNAGLILSGVAGNKIDMTNAAAFKIVRGGADKLLVNDTGVTIDGNLSVLGTTTTIDSTTINISKSFTFEGDVAGDSKTTVLDSGLPTANTTVKLPTLAAGTYHLPVLADAPTAASSLVTAAEFSLLDGATAATSPSGGSIVDADRIILNDAGTMRQVAMSDVKTYAGGAAQVLSVVAKANGDSVEADKLNLVANLTANAVLTLPASNANLVGKSIYLKASSFANNAVIIVNTQDADQKVDGENTIRLESPYAAVRLIYVATDDWRVF